MTAIQTMTLIAQYDDLVRCRGTLMAGIEPQFQEFVRNQEVCRQRWLETQTAVERLKAGIAEKEQENVALQTKLKHARSQIDHEIRKRQKVEHERDAAEHQITLIRELLNDKNNKTALNEKDREKLAFLSMECASPRTDSPPKRGLEPIGEASASLLSPSDISFDKTEEDMDTSYLRSGKKWKRGSSIGRLAGDADADTMGHEKQSRRNHRRSNSADVAAAGFGLPGIVEETPSKIKCDRERRFSSPGVCDSDVASVENYDIGAGRTAASRGVVPRTPVHETPTSIRRFGSGSTLNKQHVFASQTCIIPLTCIACGKKLRFGKPVFKCKDCRATSHGECRDLVPLPCIPSMPTPSGSKHALMTGNVADYAPSDPPMIPALVIHCVKEVEHRGLGEVGIYRVPGSEKDVKELKEKFLRGKCPNLALIDDIHVVCGCLKDFLRSLKEPLITYQLWRSFVDASERSDRFESITDMYQAISQLPQPNRDTIAYLILHLQRVAECTDCKMPISNLAKVFGPTVVGYSSAEAEPMQMLAETTKQAKCTGHQCEFIDDNGKERSRCEQKEEQVMERLMSISTDYWSMFINIDADGTRDFTTPRLSEVPHSMLGPVGTPSEIETPEKSRWFTPRNSMYGKGQPQSAKKTQFFSVPH